MVSQHIGSSIFLIAVTVGIRCAGTLVIFWALLHTRGRVKRHFNFVHNTFRLTLLIVALLALHLIEVIWWAGFYWRQKCFSDFSTSLYFSLVSYTTVGYGDVVLSDPQWRLLGGLEALTGSLMLCWSTLMLVQVLTRMFVLRVDTWEEKESLVREPIYRDVR